MNHRRTQRNRQQSHASNNQEIENEDSHDEPPPQRRAAAAVATWNPPRASSRSSNANKSAANSSRTGRVPRKHLATAPQLKGPPTAGGVKKYSRKHSRDDSSNDDEDDDDDTTDVAAAAARGVAAMPETRATKKSGDRSLKHISKKQRSGGRNESKNKKQKDSSSLAALLKRLRQYYEGAPDSDSHVDVRMARHLLEASSGNVDLAAALYWDDVLASSGGGAAAAGANNEADAADDGDEPARADLNDRESNEAEIGLDSEAGQPPAAPARQRQQDAEERPIRRRLDDEFDAMQPAQEDDEPPEDNDDLPPPVQGADDEAAAAAVDPEEDEEAGQENSVSVSDDEGATTERFRNNETRTRNGRNGVRNQRRVVSGGNVVHEEAEASDKGEKEEKMTLDSEYFSDEGWLIDDEDTSEAQPPVEVLWGAARSDCSGIAESGATSANNRSNANNIIADDDPPVELSRTSIPPTWLNAGFSMSSCGTGLVTKAPTDEEISLLRWGQHQGNSRSNVMPPYHCRGISALLSIVTAVLYSGASIQGDSVNCSSARKPFADLSKQEKIKEFDSRLTDALSALIFIAAKSSIDRKKRVVEKRYKDLATKPKEDLDIMRKQFIDRRLRLCPTCRWEEDQNTGEVRLPDGRDAGQKVRITTSFSSIDDIRNYVLSNMRSFTGKGGCALFLETIMRIHGKKSVMMMFRRARQNCQNKAATKEVEPGMIKCTCEERQKRQPQQPRSGAGSNVDNTPPGHECVSLELISLLLSGQIHSELKGWTSAGLGVGLLSNKPGEVGPALKKNGPWILRGDTCYSVLWLDGNEGIEHTPSIAATDMPGCVFKLAHWNCWFGLRNKSGMSVVTHRGKWYPPTPSRMDFSTSFRKKTATELILASRRQELSNIVSADESEEPEDSEYPSLEEVEKVTPNPDDVSYYPDEYHRWRFDMGTVAESTENGSTTNDERKEKAGRTKTTDGHIKQQENWIPYFRLSARQKLAVALTLAPRINRILWGRWPQSTIANFTPSDDPPPVV